MIEKIKNQVWVNTLETCEYIDGYENTQSIITVRCVKHDYVFTTKYENVRRTNRAHHICPHCKEEDVKARYQDSRTEVECAYCGIKFFKKNSKLGNSKSGLYFCCREHKDLAQRIDSGEEFDELRPAHYGTGLSHYRERAFAEYEHKCSVCGWDQDEDVLEVHHIDGNHNNHSMDNLIILCPICHKKLTTGKYKLINRNSIQ